MPTAAWDLDRLAAILSRLESTFEGERAAAALLASRELRKMGLAWPDLVAPLQPRPSPSHWRDLVAHCQRQPALLTTWEVDFLAALRGFKVISERQRATLEKIAARIGMPAERG